MKPILRSDEEKELVLRCQEVQCGNWLLRTFLKPSSKMCGSCHMASSFLPHQTAFSCQVSCFHATPCAQISNIFYLNKHFFFFFFLSFPSLFLFRRLLASTGHLPRFFRPPKNYVHFYCCKLLLARNSTVCTERTLKSPSSLSPGALLGLRDFAGITPLLALLLITDADPFLTT